MSTMLLNYFLATGGIFFTMITSLVIIAYVSEAKKEK